MKAYFFLLLLLFSWVHGFAQPNAVLVNQRRPSKKIILKSEWQVTYVTTRGNYSGPVISATDSCIRLGRFYKAGRDTLYTYKVPISKKYPEGIKTKKSTLYLRDTADLLLKDILMVRKPWINKRGWLLIPAYMAGGALLAVPLLPVAAIANGRDGVRNWLLFEALLVGISGPAIFIGTRRKKYVIGEKWKLAVE